VFLYVAQESGGASAAVPPEPLRFGRWLFGVAGDLPADGRWRAALGTDLPPYLQNQVASWGAAATVFAYFLKKLRETGRTEDPRLPADFSVSSLKQTVQRLLEVTSHLSALDLVIVASNGHLLTGMGVGKGTLFYRLLEGSGECPRHPGLKDGDPAAAQHRRCRSVALASSVTRMEGWRALQPNQALSADEGLRVVLAPMPSALS
jgi:glutamine amidotransferase